MTKVEKSHKSILIIEPNVGIRETLVDFLSSEYSCQESACIGKTFEEIEEKDFDIVISNFDLQDADALELLGSLQFLSPETAVIFIGKNNSSKDIIEAFRAGAFDFIQKPFEFEELENSIERAINHHQTNLRKDNYDKHLENLVSERDEKLGKALKDVENSYRTTLKVLIQALETRDSETYGHSERVVTFSLRLAHEMGLEEDEMRDLELGALLHDIGKIGVPDSILRKPAKLTDREWDKMKLHPQLGFKILRNIPFLKGAAKIVAEHHERWDGKGYPHQIRGENISLTTRIFAVADAFDAMISDRVYRRGRSFEDAAAELEKHAGTQFDPMVVEAFKNIPKEDWENLKVRSLKEKHEIFSSREIVAELVNSKHYFEMVH